MRTLPCPPSAIYAVRKLAMIASVSRIASLACCTAALLGCSRRAGDEVQPGKITVIEATPEAQKRAQTALINAEPGDTIEFAAGNFNFTSTLSLDVSDITIRGQGPGKYGGYRGNR